MSFRNSPLEEIPGASTWDFRDLEASLVQQEQHSREALGSALDKKQESLNGEAPSSTSHALVLPREDATPREIFAHTLEHPLQYPSLTAGSARMVRYDKPDEILVYTSGQAIMTDSKKRAGCAVVYETEDNPMSSPVVLSLEKKETSGEPNYNTPFAAALRALVAALELKAWASEGWKQVTIAIDDTRVYRGITHDIHKWASKGWLEEGAKQHPPRPELWRRAVDLVNEQAYHGCEVSFLLVTAEQNQRTAELARKIASSNSVL